MAFIKIAPTINAKIPNKNLVDVFIASEIKLRNKYELKRRGKLLV